MKNEWIVWPPTFKAAMPVGATIAQFPLYLSLNSWMTVDFPVPAKPDKKRFFPASIVLNATCWSWLSMLSVTWLSELSIKVDAMGLEADGVNI